MPKQFIQKVLIDEIGEIHKNYPYIAFASMTIGIEFLGKCLNTHEDWNKKNRSKKDFQLAVNALNSFSKYKPLLRSHKLWDSMRNGFLHSFVPKESISLSRKGEMAHMNKITDKKINLECEEFYKDFKMACEKVIEMNNFKSGKMNRALLYVPKV